jgi:hypothetical protein
VSYQHVFADKDGSGSQTTAAKKTALIIVGGGQRDVEHGQSDADLDQGLRQEFQKYLQGCAVTLRHVKSAEDMTKLIADSTWDVVIYFGHGVRGAGQLLAPGDGYGYLHPEDLIAALQRAKPSRVYLFGCDSAQTGLARRVSKELNDASVFGMTGDLDVELRTDHVNNTTKHTATFKQEPVEFVNGRYFVGGKAPDRRPHELSDPINADGGPDGPFDDSVPNQ